MNIKVNVKRFTSKSTGIQYYVACDEFNRPCKIFTIRDKDGKELMLSSIKEEQKLLKKFSKTMNSDLSLDEKLNKNINIFLEENQELISKSLSIMGGAVLFTCQLGLYAIVEAIESH